MRVKVWRWVLRALAVSWFVSCGLLIFSLLGGGERGEREGRWGESSNYHYHHISPRLYHGLGAIWPIWRIRPVSLWRSFLSVSARLRRGGFWSLGRRSGCGLGGCCRGSIAMVFVSIVETVL